MVARVVREWGRIDVLVANAGGGRRRPTHTKASTLDPALLQLVSDMNLFGTVYSCNAVAPTGHSRSIIVAYWGHAPSSRANTRVATKRALRAILKGADLCVSEPKRVAQQLVDEGYTKRYDYALQDLSEMRFDG
jgi:NAD(P)-dependent dehydrogenase (short-subunit alcohol dehydrogenase family)